MTSTYKVGDKIILFKRHQEAIIRYIGKTEFAPDKISYGIELLDDGIGDNNGAVNNIKYFTCPENKGLFVWDKDIKFKIQTRKKRAKSFKKDGQIEKRPIRKSIHDIYSDLEPKSKPREPTIQRQQSQKKLGPRDIGRHDDYNTNTTSKKSVKKKKSKKQVNKNKNKKPSKKSGPRDVGRNDAYVGIDDVKVNKKKRKKKKKKRSAKKNKNSVKNSKKDNNKMNISNGNVSDSDSYKSGYSGASGHSQFDNDDSNDDTIINGNDSNESNDTYSDSESGYNELEGEEEEEEEEDTLTRKVMLMMKEKEEQKELEMKEKEKQRELEEQRMIDEQNKIAIVAMSHRDDGNKLTFEDNDKEYDDGHNESIDNMEYDDGHDETIENMEYDDGNNENVGMENVDDMNKEKTYEEEIDDDLPEVRRSSSEEVDNLKTYAKRKHTVEMDEDIIIKTDTGNKDIDIEYNDSETSNGKIEIGNVNDEKENIVAENKDCCVVL